VNSVKAERTGRAHAMGAVRAAGADARPPFARDPTTRTELDSNRVVRNAVAAAIAAAVVGGGSSVAADTEERVERTSDSTVRSRTSVMHHAVWRTRAKPRSAKTRRAGTTDRSKAYAFRLVARKTWPGQQFRCLDSLWTRESNWNHRAYNRGSGAYGIPQALPGWKMSLVAMDWRLNPHTQIKWGLNYIKGRYGSPCGAWGHFRSHNWY
jgi:hypothetical protein